MLKGFPSWNVPLAMTLNNLPPSIHQNSLSSKKLVKPEKVDFVKTLGNSDFIMTGAKDGSINIWNTRVKLHCTGSHNFKSKMYEPEDVHHLSIDQVNKKLLNGANVEEVKKGGDIDVKLIIKKNNKFSKDSKSEEITEDILFTMFEEQ